MPPFAPPPSLSLHLQFFSLPPFTLSFLRSNPSPSDSLPPLSVSLFPFSLPYNHRHHHHHKSPNPQLPPQIDDEDTSIGDCLVFEEDAFEDPTPPDVPTTSSSSPPPTESLVPDKWKEAVEEMKLTKKERRKISQQLRFGSKMERKVKSPMPSVEEYEAFKQLKLSQLRPVVLDDPAGFCPRKEEKMEAVTGGRVEPRNPRLGLGEGSLDDIRDFFNSGRYVPGEIDDDKKPRGPRKLFTHEEKILLNKRVPNLEEATSSKWLPQHTLAASGESYLLDALLKHNVDINALDKDGLSAIHKAVLCKKHAIVNYLLRNSANPSVRDRDGATLIHYAVQTASSQTIKILLLYSVDINLADHDGWTPLHLAVQTKRTDIVKLLLIKGAAKDIKNRDGLTPLDLCLYSGHDLRTYELIKLLKGRRASKAVA